jgi:PmbA protein
LSAVSAEKTAARAAYGALKLMGSRRFKTAKKCAVALENHVAVDFLSVLASSLSSENVQKGKSMLADKTGSKIVSERMCLVDDALLARASGSRPFDAEGVASRRNVLVEGGVLRGFAYNTHTAAKGGVSSTGNAVRGGISSVPGVGFSNLCIEPVSKEFVYPVGGLVSIYDECLLITDVMGMHTANTVSGDFSVGVNGLWVEGGKISYPVKEAVVSGNILGFFEKVEAFGDDLKFYGSTGSPSLLVRDVEVSA